MLQTLEHIWPGMKSAKIISVFDALNGFWQVKLDKDSSKLTSFATPFGRYCWKRLTFGIGSAPKEYQRRMQDTLEGIEGEHIYADDLMCSNGNNYADAEADHDEKIGKVV